MKIRIYQINPNRDRNSLQFISYERTMARLKMLGQSKIDSNIYSCVFYGDVEASSLEEIFAYFNADVHDESFYGRSMSVSDVVEVIGEDSASTFYFCNSVGFKEIEFNKENATHAKMPYINAILCQPNKKAKVIRVKNSPNAFQCSLGSIVEVINPFKDQSICLIRAEGDQYTKKNVNRAIYNYRTRKSEFIYGDFLICAFYHDFYQSLSDEQLKVCMDQVMYPQKFIRVNDTVHAIRDFAAYC